MTIWNASERPKLFPQPFGTLRPVSHGLIGDIRDANKKGYYLTPFGWLKVDRPARISRGYMVFFGRCLSYDRTILVERYNTKLGVKLPEESPVVSRIYDKRKYLNTKRGFR